MGNGKIEYLAKNLKDKKDGKDKKEIKKEIRNGLISGDILRSGNLRMYLR